MGNSQSNETPKSPAAGSSATTPQGLTRRVRERDVPSRPGAAADASGQEVRKAHSHFSKSGHTPPTASLVPSTTPAAPSTSNTHAQATVTASHPTSSHTRQRSTTAGETRLKPEDPSQQADMGNTESRHRSPARAATAPTASSKEKSQASQQKPVESNGVDGGEAFAESELMDSDSPYGYPPSNYGRPPRLPLALADPEPSSPMMSPQATTASPDRQSIPEEGLRRRASMLSSTTLDDDEAADIEAFALESDPYAQKVPTTFEWRKRGRTVYVTGTFVNWERKFKLSQNEKGIFSATIPLPTGTHHIKFLIDGNMVTSDDLPTTVDYTNVLLNYIEVVAPLPATKDAQPPAPAEPMPIPGAAATAEQAPGPGEHNARRQNYRVRAPETDLESNLDSGDSETHASSTDRPSQPPTTSGPFAHPQTDQQTARTHINHAVAGLEHEQPPRYTNQIPEMLLHLDFCSNAEDERYQRATKAIQNLPQPPSLPSFMQKSVLNAATPQKDDASVLTIPNHTVLNHLATSSIRHGVLATSGTTRYKRKFLTTILYKPTSDDG